MLLSGGILALTLRAELSQPGIQIVQPEFFNQLTTMHGLIMVFGAIMPAFVGFANWQIPLMIGASDMAFARMNNFSFWLLPPAALLLVGSFFRAWWRNSCWLDLVCTLVGPNGSRYGYGNFRGPHHGCELNHGFDQYHHHDS
jgi:heme/copper-type cytochrome/quinol oxidase subunit 1